MMDTYESSLAFVPIMQTQEELDDMIQHDSKMAPIVCSAVSELSVAYLDLCEGSHYLRGSSGSFNDAMETSSFRYLLPLAFTNFHRIPLTSTKSPCVCTIFHYHHSGRTAMGAGGGPLIPINSTIFYQNTLTDRFYPGGFGASIPLVEPPPQPAPVSEGPRRGRLETPVGKPSSSAAPGGNRTPSPFGNTSVPLQLLQP